jgi:hypothetical protein
MGLEVSEFGIGLSHYGAIIFIGIMLFCVLLIAGCLGADLMSADSHDEHTPAPARRRLLFTAVAAAAMGLGLAFGWGSAHAAQPICSPPDCSLLTQAGA